MQRSNLYIVVFMAIVAILVGGLLALAATGLKEKQTESIELDTKRQILSAVMPLTKTSDIKAIYEKQIKGVVVDIEGKEVEKDEEGNLLAADKINIGKEFKKELAKRKFPVFVYSDESGKVQAYIIPTFGNGLWNTISGFVAVSSDLNTVFGASFNHVGETPGLGARISDKDIQDRYKGKKIFDDKGELKSVFMVKGEGNVVNDVHQVDGMSGATITGRGLNDMLKNYFGYYSTYFKKLKSSDAPKEMEAPIQGVVDSLGNKIDSLATQDSSKKAS